jgi:glycosyltransferase involved in cell wall biosynthesis
MGEADSMTVIVPAFNEAENLEATVREVLDAVGRGFDDYEILIFDDASRDGTAAIADRLAADHAGVRVFHNSSNRGLGWNYRAGVRQARMERVMLVNGKHDVDAASLRAILARRHDADLVVPYPVNAEDRSWARRVVSRSFTRLMDLLSGYRLRYYNDSVVHRTAQVRELTLRTNSYAYTAEALIKALRRGRTHVEVPIRCRFGAAGRTRAFRPRNVLGVGVFLLCLLYDLYVRRER